MPRPKPDAETTAVLVRLPTDLLAVIDTMRGKMPRNTFIRKCCEAAIVVKLPPRAEPAPAPPPAIKAEVLTFGPVKSSPGSRLKKSKGDK